MGERQSLCGTPMLRYTVKDLQPSFDLYPIIIKNVCNVVINLPINAKGNYVFVQHNIAIDRAKGLHEFSKCCIHDLFSVIQCIKCIIGVLSIGPPVDLPGMKPNCTSGRIWPRFLLIH